MKRIVDGEEVELQPSSAVEVFQLQDRLAVRGLNGARSALAVRIGDAIHVSFRGRVFVVEKPGTSRRAHSAVSSGEIRATMPGQIVDVFVQQNQKVKAGEKLVVLEAMKTQQSFTAPYDGVISEVKVAKGQQVLDGQLLVVAAADEVV